MNYYPSTVEEDLGTNSVDRPLDRPIYRPTKRPTFYVQEGSPEESPFEDSSDTPFYDQRPNFSGKHYRDTNIKIFLHFLSLRLLYHEKIHNRSIVATTHYAYFLPGFLIHIFFSHD